jgi:hypothetical protein
VRRRAVGDLNGPGLLLEQDFRRNADQENTRRYQRQKEEDWITEVTGNPG